jgi:hypothetical protein
LFSVESLRAQQDLCKPAVACSIIIAGPRRCQVYGVRGTASAPVCALMALLVAPPSELLLGLEPFTAWGRTLNPLRVCANPRSCTAYLSCGAMLLCTTHLWLSAEVHSFVAFGPSRLLARVTSVCPLRVSKMPACSRSTSTMHAHPRTRGPRACTLAQATCAHSRARAPCVRTLGHERYACVHPGM